MEYREKLLETLELQLAGFAGWGAESSPFYARLCEYMRADVEVDGPVAQIFAPYAGGRLEDAYVLRFLGAVHRRVLGGTAPELAAHFPSVDGDGDATAAFVHVRAIAADPPPDVVEAFTRPPQTNEVARSATLASGLAVIAVETGLPIVLREIGASAGVNLRPDSYYYEQDGRRWGDPDSPVRFVDLWRGGVPPFDAGARILDRRGCDQDPIDVTDPDGALTLLSYVWPEPRERFDRAKSAVALASADPPPVDRADAAEWLVTQFPGSRESAVLVVQHSAMWNYMTEQTRADVERRIRAAGAAASPEAPVAWLRFEPRPVEFVPGELTLTLWDGTTPDPPDRLLATAPFHGGRIEWLADRD